MLRSSASVRVLSVFGLLVLLLSASIPCLAQEAPAEPPPADARPTEGPTETTPADITDLLKQIESDQTLPEGTRVEAAGLYRQAIDFLTQAETWKQKTEEFRAGRESVPALLDEIKTRQTATSTATTVPTPSAEASLEELSRRLTEAEAEAKSQQDAMQRLDQEAERRTERRAAIPQLLARVAARQETVTKQLAEPPNASSPQTVQLARRTLLNAERAAALNEQQAYQEELRFYDARSELLTLRRDEARTLALRAEERVEAQRNIVATRRESETARQRALAEAEARQAPAVIRDLAEGNRQFAKDWDDLAAKIKAVEEEKQRTSTLFDQLGQQFERIKSHAELAGKSDLVGPMMRSLRVELIRLRRFSRDLEQTRSDFAQIQLAKSEVEAESNRLLNIPRAASTHLEAFLAVEPNLDVDRLRPQLEELLASRLDLVRKLKPDYEAYETDLLELATTQNTLLKRVEQMTEFVDERVLWVRSTVPLHQTSFSIDVSAWREALGTIATAWRNSIVARWWVYTGVALAFLTFAWRRTYLLDQLRQTSEMVSKPLHDRYTLTLNALLITLLLALPLPTLMWLASWYLHSMDAGGNAMAFDLSNAASHALWGAGTILLLLSFVHQSGRRYGLAPGHLRWDSKSLGILRRHLLWYTPLLVPLVSVVVATERISNNSLGASVGRLAFLVSIVISVFFVRQVFHPVRGVLAHYLAKRQTSLAARLRWPAYLSSQALLVGLALASVSGYHYTALALSDALVRMLVMTGGVLLVHALAVRWVFYTQRKLAIEEARQRREEQSTETRPEDEQANPEVELDDVALKIGEIGEQTRTLLSSFAWVGFVLVVWLAWADLLPALSFLQEVQLWSYTSQVATVDTSGQVVQRQELRWITLASLLMATLILVVAYVLNRNLPGLLEIAVLRRLPIDTGGRFAITAISRYVITIVGVVLAFGRLGIGWSSVQWLVAAITVGLGFGLQEIFANFVSGLILLFERPIRIGDTVTVGNVSGTVTRIRIRATTITDWDRKELIIPNREFVTGQVINWTLTDQITRLIVKVGIAYGSDTDAAKRILLDIAKQNPRVLDQPPPRVWFCEFGASSLNFEMRVFTKDIDDWLLSRDELHFQVDNAFRKARIEIAFPQQDLHVRSIDQALVVDNKDRAAKPGVSD